MNKPRPFADAVVAYAQAGWPAILPVPIDKHPPPVGYTGAEGADTTPDQLAAWFETHAESSIALRMPDGVIGIDVDAYVKGKITKHGDTTHAAAIERFGPLPATWSSTARGEGPSRISFYRVPLGRYVTALRPDVEIIQRHHRYAVVWPSPHVDAGDIYRWYGPDGAECAPPKPGELPELPQTWIDGLREGATEAGPGMAPYAAGEAMMAVLRTDDRIACAEVSSAAMVAWEELSKADVGSRHDTMTGRVHQLVQLGSHGHPGAGTALTALGDLWAQLTSGEDREAEWERMLLTSARKAVTAIGQQTPVTNDPCLMAGSFTVAAPAPTPIDGHAPEPIEPPEDLHPYEAIGAHLFDPRGGLDQTLAEAVLERMYPVLRYGWDARTWLLRGRTRWESSADLSRWAVARLANLMPIGDTDAEKGSDSRDQAERRKRFMSSGPARAIAGKMADTLAGGGHPCAVRLSDLDADPWLLWAGGVAWDLRASTHGPVAALVDPATPHMHSAGIAPDARETPLWDAFTAAVWPDPELRAWALRVLSIAATGYPDAALPILVGETRRGKTSLIDLLMSVLGTYAHSADPRLLTSTDRAHASIIYALKGRRLSFIDEAPRDSGPGRERLKQLTGGAELTGNRMGENPITFRPTHTLILTANDEPILTDAAIRARVRLIPCDGDPDQVRAARIAIGYVHDPAWRTEAPGVLAALMRESAAWLVDRDSALTSAAPDPYRYRAEEIAAEQDPIRAWLDGETEPWTAGTRSRELYEAFVGWCRNGSIHPGHIPSETKWGRELTRFGYPSQHRRDGFRRELRVRARGGWVVPEPRDGLTASGDGLVTGWLANPSQAETPGNPEKSRAETISVTGVTGLSEGITHTPTHTHTHTPAYAHGPEPTRHPITPITPVTPQANSAKIAASLLAGRAEALANPPAAPPAKAKRTRLTDAEKADRAAERAQARTEAKAVELGERIAEAAGPLVELPALVLSDGRVLPLSIAQLGETAQAFDWLSALTVDVEHTGYPIGHADYALRTVQIGNKLAAAVLDADDAIQMAAAAVLLRDAEQLHAHSSQADLVPLAVADLIDFEFASARMLDTVLPAKLLDPASTGSDPDLKGLSANVLGAIATSPGAEIAKNALFKAGKWLIKTEPTTPIARSGWAQSDRCCTTMVRYAGSDVLDGAALADRFYAPGVLPAELLDRERTAQRMTSRVSYRGIALDADRVNTLMPQQQAAREDAADRLRAAGVDSPGSDTQIAAKALELGAALPLTKTGRASVAKGALERYRRQDGPLGDFVRARLDYQKAKNRITLFLAHYEAMVARGDGRARPTVYTLAADTGRMSCVRPNLQQVPREGGYRSCITADPGQLLVSADFASVEIRVAAALSGDATLRALLDAGVDVHGEVAKQAFGPEFTKADRYDTKRGVFGWLYGASIETIARTLGVSESIAAAIVDSLKAMAPELVQWSFGVREAVKNGHSKFPSYSGRVIHLPAKSPHAGPNYCIQGTARELLIDALIRWETTPWGLATLLPVHDEILVAVPADEAEAATSALVAAMETTLYGVQIAAEASEPSFAWADAA